MSGLVAVAIGATTAVSETTSSMPSLPGLLAFAADVDGNWDLFLLRTGDGRPLRLTETPLDERSPALAPNGKNIAFSRSDGRLGILDIESGAVYLLPLDGKRYGSPTWTTDGTKLVFTAYDFSGGEEEADLVEHDLSNKRTRPFLAAHGIQDRAAFDPKGRFLAFTWADAVALPQKSFQVVERLWLLRLVDGELRQLPALIGQATDPTWSPDGNMVAFAWDGSGSVDLWLVRRDGSGLRQLTDAPGAEVQPTWSPDGTFIAFVHKHGEGTALQILGVSSGTAHSLRPFGDASINIMWPHWK